MEAQQEGKIQEGGADLILWDRNLGVIPEEFRIHCRSSGMRLSFHPITMWTWRILKSQKTTTSSTVGKLMPVDARM